MQTIVAAQLRFPRPPPSTSRLVEVSGGDRVVVEVSTPEAWRHEDPTVVLVHGLCGCARSPYVARLARKLHRLGIRTARMNLRGCGPGRGLAREPYHSGRSNDLLRVLEDLQGEGPRSPLTLVGFSLGGNMTLKLAGELGEAAHRLLRQVIAVCPPVDLQASSRRLSRPENRLYENVFVRLLRQDAHYREGLIAGRPPLALPRRLTLREFDDVYTAPRCGFDSVLDYYTRASSAPLLERIQTPCRILVAGDDPLVDASVLRDLRLPGHVQVLWTERGGHLGFLGMPGSPGGFHWMDSVLMAWVVD